MNNFSLKSGSNLFFLIGFMGSGKSLLSHGVSKALDIISIEMDEEIERSAKMSINEIFTTEGEDTFRKMEQNVLHQIVQQYHNSSKIVIVSTGGGAPCHFDNMDVMNEAGTTIFINPSVDRLSARLEHKKKHRPLIRNRNYSEIRDYVESTLKTRLPYYNKAMIHVNMLNDDKLQNIDFLKDIILSAGADIMK